LRIGLEGRAKKIGELQKREVHAGESDSFRDGRLRGGAMPSAGKRGVWRGSSLYAGQNGTFVEKKKRGNCKKRPDTMTGLGAKWARRPDEKRLRQRD